MANVHKKEVAKKIDCWIKSRDVSFYAITYVLKRGTNPKDCYFFNILSPISYPTFEKMLKDGTYFNGFKSDLEVKL